MKKWLDNFGKADNANDSIVSLSEDFVGLGYNTKGRNYSPAWGGQFAMGGSLPGATGMMYVRYEEGGIIPSAQNGKFLPVSLSQQVQQSVKPTPTVPYLQTKDPREFYKSWIQSPEYEQRLKSTGYSDLPDKWLDGKDVNPIDYTKKQRLDLLENIQPFEYDKYKKSEARPFDIGGPTININPLDYQGSSRQSIEAHEIGHVGTPTMSYQESQIIRDSMLPMKEPVLSGVQGSKEREASKIALEDFKHLQKPEEAKADLDALRFMMYDKGIYDITKGKKFTETDFEKAKQNLGKDRVFKRLENRMGKKNFVKLMNTIASADSEELPIAMGGMSIPGSVGFTYARTAGSAPSKGKYAKKTMASAQKGKDIEKDATNLAVSNKIAQLQLLENPEYQYQKYLESLPQLKQAPGFGEKALRAADVATDVMQMGNFIPNPIAQAIAKVGNVAGTAIDAYQAAADVYGGDYTSAGFNAASAVLPSVLGANTFRRNTMMLRPGDPLYQLTEQSRRAANSPINLNKTDTGYLELFSNVKGMTDKSLLTNRALLGTLGAETAYDADLIGPVKKEYGGDVPSAQSGITSPLLLTKTILNFINPSKENVAKTSIAVPANYEKGLTNELLQRQAYKESTFNPSAVSPAGYKGLTQIGEEVLTDYSKKKGGKKLDPFNAKDAVELQKFAMDDLYNSSFINKPDQPDSVRLAKTLAAYNWGRGNLVSYLNEQKQKGVDIYESYDWLNDLPKETSDYVNKILLQEDASFNKNYKKDSTNPKYKDVTSLYENKEFGGQIPSAQKGKNDIEKISIDDPRYPEMYKNRQVGLSYDGTISLPDLDEVTITAPRSYTMDSLRDFTSAALYGAPATAMKLEAIPQAAMTETIEMLRGRPYDFSNVNPNIGSFSSNQRDLSQTLGYENPEGFLQNAVNLGLSAIDPVIVSGASKVAGKQLAKKAVKAVDLDDVAKRKIHLQKLKDEKLIHPDTDINKYSKSLSDTEELTKKALTQRETYYRGVTPKIPEGPEQQLIIEEMTKAGVDISNPEDVGRYMATHIPFQKLDYNAGFATNDPRYNALYTSGGFSRYGDMTFEMTRPLDFSKGSYSNWLDELYKYPVYNPSEKIDDLPLFTRAYALENRPGPGVFVGTKGQKIFNDARLVTNDYGRIKSKPLPGIDVQATGGTVKKFKNGGKVTTAQNGQEMKFYQNGLDWKPKSMQDGGEEDFIGKATKFVSEGISGPVTTAALGLLNMVKPISNPEIYKTVRPVGYPNALQLPMHAYNYLMGNESEPLKTKSGKPHLAEEFWATAMGMPGERQYLKESKYKPSVAKDSDAKYYTIRDVIDDYELMNLTKDLKPGEKMEMNGLLPILDSKWYSENADTDKNVKFGDVDPLQRFTLQKSPDGSYVSIYDKYDFNNPALNKMMKPIEIYDRFYLPKKRKGGVIKDDRGQWAHPGKVTEIDSNYITMEGVPYDVVGVSDAGDTKLMKPGKNYKFKGKKVTEFPVAELGINQLDAQPMKKLNQLLNFTNNPDKDNWLDKYN